MYHDIRVTDSAGKTAIDNAQPLSPVVSLRDFVQRLSLRDLLPALQA